jgi:hypothetical protein
VQDAVLPETFLRHDLLLEPEEAAVRAAGAIELAGEYLFEPYASESSSYSSYHPPISIVPSGRFSFDLSAPITPGQSLRRASVVCEPELTLGDWDLDTFMCALASARLAVRTVELLLEDRSAKGAFALW